jgi:hypothetical protein
MLEEVYGWVWMWTNSRTFCLFNLSLLILALQSFSTTVQWGFFSFQSCDVGGGLAPQENLAKFGYKSERKVEKFRNHVIFWPPARTYYLNMVISKQFPVM